MDVREKLVELLDGMFNGECCVDKTEASDFLIAHGVTVQEWISVKDRLPEEWQKVLVFVPSIDVITMAKLRGGSWYATWDSMRIDNVAYWLPIPQPPKGE